MKDDKKEYSIIDLIRLVWKRKKFIVLSTSVFIILGVFTFVSIPKEYTSSIVLMPQSSDNSDGFGGGLGELAGLAGVSIPKSSSSIDKQLYPEIISSNIFYLELMNQKFKNSTEKDSLVLFEILKEYDDRSIFEQFFGFIKSMPSTLRGLFTGAEKKDYAPDEYSLENSLLELNPAQRRVISHLKSRINLQDDKMNGLITISCELPDPVLSAHVVVYTKDYLTEFLSSYKTEKLRDNLDFLKAQLKKAQKDYVNLQVELAKLRDTNINLSNTLSRTKEERLSSEFSLASQLYSNLAKEVAQAEIQIQKQTPYFRVLEPSQVPTTYSVPNEKLILFVFTFLGLLISILFVLVQEIIIKGNSIKL